MFPRPQTFQNPYPGRTKAGVWHIAIWLVAIVCAAISGYLHRDMPTGPWGTLLVAAIAILCANTIYFGFIVRQISVGRTKFGGVDTYLDSKAMAVASVFLVADLIVIFVVQIRG